MTLYLAFESIERGQADVEDIVTVTPHASTVGRYRMGLRSGEHVPLRVDGVRRPQFDLVARVREQAPHAAESRRQDEGRPAVAGRPSR